MKLLSTTILSLLLASACHAQYQQLYSQIFTDSVMGKVLVPPLGLTPPPKTYKLLSRTDAWQLRRFYFQPPAPNQHQEGINIYAYGDALLAMMISKDEWNMLAHRALVQKTAKIKRLPTNVALVDSTHMPEEDVFFSITEPVFYKNWALIDMTYYRRDEERISPEQCFQGQALFVFMKQSKHKWALVKVVNKFIL